MLQTESKSRHVSCARANGVHEDVFDFTLVLSASVDPKGMTGISKESLLNREQQYIDTLVFYASCPGIPRILFVENSGWPLERLKAAVETFGDKVAWLALDVNDYPREWGKGYGEFAMLDRAVAYLIGQEGGGARPIVKATGRFPVLNIEAMVREFSARKPLALALDVLDHPIYDWLRLGWDGHHARTILYAVTPVFYREHMMGRYREIPERFSGAEDLMFDIWRRARSLPGVWPRFRREPRLSGFAGSGRLCVITAYNHDGVAAGIKRAIRQAARWALPFLWI